MITFVWKGVLSTAELTKSGWVGPPDCNLSAFADEATAAARLGGVTAIELDPATTPTAPKPEAMKNGRS